MTHEVRLQNDEQLFGAFDYVAGYYHSALDAGTRFTRQIPVLLPWAFGGGVATIQNIPISSLSDGDITEEFIFGNLTAHNGESTEISGGLRQIQHSGQSTYDF